MSFEFRKFSGPDDIPLIKWLISRLWETDGCAAPMTPGDVDWGLFQHIGKDFGELIRLWYKGSELVAIGWFTPGDEFEPIMLEEHREMSLFEPMLAEAERQRIAAGGMQDGSVSVWASESDLALSFILQRLEYEAGPPKFVHFYRELASLGSSDPLDEAPHCADGYRIRSVHGAEDLAHRVAVHRNAFHPSRVTEASYGNVMQSGHYRADTDIVAEAPDGSFAAFALGWIDPELRVAELEPVGAHNDHRRKGLARAVSIEALRRMRDLGAERAMIHAHPDSHAATLYASLGFEIVNTSHFYTRQDPPARSGAK